MLNRRAFFAAVLGAPVIAALGIKTVSDAEYWSALKFLAGDQWPAEIAAKRLAQGRPCLVFNRLPALVVRFAGELHLARERDLTLEEMKTLVVETVRLNKTNQMLYNYYRTAEAEILAYGTKSPVPAVGATWRI